MLKHDNGQKRSPALLACGDDAVLPALLTSLASPLCTVPDDALEPWDEPEKKGLALALKDVLLKAMSGFNCRPSL